MKQPIPNYPGYFADETGIIYRELKTGSYRPLKPSNSRQYLKVDLYVNKTRHSKKIHQLVLEAFGQRRPSKKYVVRHLNDIPDDNRLVNLKWGTEAENIKDKQHNLDVIPTELIRKAYTLGMSVHELALICKRPQKDIQNCL